MITESTGDSTGGEGAELSVYQGSFFLQQQVVSAQKPVTDQKP